MIHVNACRSVKDVFKAQKAALIAWLPVVRVGNLVKDRRPPISAFTRVFDALWAAALRAVLDKIINTNNRHPCDQGRQLDESQTIWADYRRPVLASMVRPQSTFNLPETPIGP